VPTESQCRSDYGDKMWHWIWIRERNQEKMERGQRTKQAIVSDIFPQTGHKPATRSSRQGTADQNGISSKNRNETVAQTPASKKLGHAHKSRMFAFLGVSCSAIGRGASERSNSHLDNHLQFPFVSLTCFPNRAHLRLTPGHGQM